MNTATIVAATLFFIIVPAALIALTQRLRWAEKIGAIGLCYIAGLILGNLGLTNESIQSVQTSLTDLSIAIALPMLLMTLNIAQWRNRAGVAIVSMLLATTSVVTIATAMYFLWQTNPESTFDPSHMAAMAVGVYTGGTPNLASIKAGLDIPHANYLVFHSLDTVVGAVYLVFMLSAAIPLVKRYYPKFNATNTTTQASQNSALADVTAPEITDVLERYGDNYRPLLKRSNLRQLLVIGSLALGCMGISLILTQCAVNLWDWENPTALSIVLLTLSGMGLSLMRPIQRLDLAYRFGMYWIYVFCFTVATMANFDSITDVDPAIIGFILAVITGSLVLHALFCKLAKVDGDTFMITSVAAICSPPFVPLMAKALNNSSLILSGMTTGIIGYALGNFLGITLALALQSIP